MLDVLFGKLSLSRLADVSLLELVLTCLALYLLFIAWDVFLGPLSHIPGPKSSAASYLPKAWMLWTGSEADTIHRLHEQYGPAVRIAPREISYTDAVAWKDIYGHKFSGTKTFEKDKSFYRSDPSQPLHIVNSDSDGHSRQRRILANSFSDKALREQEPLLKHWANLMITKLTEVANAGKAADLVAYYNYTTFDVMGDLTFAEPLYMLEGSEYSPWVKTIFAGIKVSGKLNAIKQLPFMAEIMQKLMPKSVRQKIHDHNKFSADRVDRRLARDPGRPDLWSEVIKRSDNGSGDATAGMSLGEMHSNAGIFMVAGTETTATLLSGLTYHLLSNPNKMDKLVAEIRNAFKEESDVTVDSLAKLSYLNACIEEGLRMYPPVPTGLPRKVPSPGAAIAGTWIPGDVTVSVNHWATYHDPKNFSQPFEFAPERFLGAAEFAGDNLAALQPFSTGPRNCLGRNLAYHEIRLLLAMTLWNFDLELEESSRDWADQKVFILWDKKPLMVKLKAVR